MKFEVEVTLKLDGTAEFLLRKLLSDKGVDLRLSVSTLPLPVRTKTCLRNIGIQYLDEVEYISESDILRVPNFGRHSLNELKETCKIHDIVVGRRSEKMSRPYDFDWKAFFEEKRAA